MNKVQKGNVVLFNYVGKLDDGTIFEESPKDKPISMTIGKPDQLPELEMSLIGKEIGTKTNLVLPPDKGFGNYKEELVVPLSRKILPMDMKLDKGQYLLYVTEAHEIKRVKVVDADETWLYFDYNHPLAGKTLHYDIEILNIQNADAAA